MSRAKTAVLRAAKIATGGLVMALSGASMLAQGLISQMQFQAMSSRREPGMGGRRRARSRYKPHAGRQERARRLRQIGRGWHAVWVPPVPIEPIPEPAPAPKPKRTRKPADLAAAAAKRAAAGTSTKLRAPRKTKDQSNGAT